jgi:hypothetical protein
MNKIVINIIFSTTIKENTINLLQSIGKLVSIEKEQNHELLITVLDKTIDQEISLIKKEFNFQIDVIDTFKILELEQEYVSYFQDANCSKQWDSIQRTRIQQQIYIIENYSKFKNSVVWQLDDDLLFGRSDYSSSHHSINFDIDYFSKIVAVYKAKTDVDAIISPTSYVPPIPSLLYCKSQLDDYFNGKYISGNPVTFKQYHDYHNRDNEDGTYLIFLSKSEERIDVVRNILKGIPVTKAVILDRSNQEIIYKTSKLFRGGNFIVFNPDIFKVPHLGFSECNEIPARRSDMIHARLLIENGFNIVDIDYFSLVHNRQFNEASMDNSIKKYYSDMIGSMLIQYLDNGVDEFYNRLKFHKKHIQEILKLLICNVDEEEFQEEIKSLIELDNKINELDGQRLVNQFDSFLIIKNQLNKELCRLVL